MSSFLFSNSEISAALIAAEHARDLDPTFAEGIELEALALTWRQANARAVVARYGNNSADVCDALAALADHAIDRDNARPAWRAEENDNRAAASLKALTSLRYNSAEDPCQNERAKVGRDLLDEAIAILEPVATPSRFAAWL